MITLRVREQFYLLHAVEKEGCTTWQLARPAAIGDTLQVEAADLFSRATFTPVIRDGKELAADPIALVRFCSFVGENT